MLHLAARVNSQYRGERVALRGVRLNHAMRITWNRHPVDPTDVFGSLRDDNY